MSSVSVDGPKIRRLREEKSLDRAELAEWIGISNHRLYMIEMRQGNTRRSVVRKLAMALGVSPEDLRLDTASV